MASSSAADEGGRRKRTRDAGAEDVPFKMVFVNDEEAQLDRALMRLLFEDNRRFEYLVCGHPQMEGVRAEWNGNIGKEYSIMRSTFLLLADVVRTGNANSLDNREARQVREASDTIGTFHSVLRALDKRQKHHAIRAARCCTSPDQDLTAAFEWSTNPEKHNEDGWETVLCFRGNEYRAVYYRRPREPEAAST